MIVKAGVAGGDRALREASALGTEHGVAVLALAFDQDWTDLIGRLRALLAVGVGPGARQGAVLGRRHDLVTKPNTHAPHVNVTHNNFTTD
ncbi:hypothetical protein ACFC18_53940, partial [Streptomyces sp. NPDC056121]|uniref:hypothetical protein n=1 Tax=Streptomyces sp. NPDC056121 TaxID=3345718 RepID=UPI0035DB22E4